MPSLIPDYEYDIFISYRQKDNVPLTGQGRQTADGWVTEFVAYLKRELEVTFKEEVSVYIDENTYDGIREVHEVSESLASKLKCIIFIPIISQTYCDPKCYAWNNEFIIFKQLALTDQFGLKIKLQNGNVASRIIPVRIHELDVQDGLLMMKELGGPLRSIDFIFRTPGVNRPLRAHEDHANDNRDKTYYRDQINKVANSIKEIMVAVQSPTVESSRQHTRTLTPQGYSEWGKKLWMAGISLSVLILIAFFLLRNSSDFLSTSDEKLSVAVIPFRAIGVDEESQNFADGVADVIVSNLVMFPELNVKSKLSVEKYKDGLKTVPEIGAELGVAYILEGSAQRIGNDIRIIVRLVDTRSDVNVWSERFDKKFENIFEIQNQISLSIAKSLKAKLTAAIEDKIKRAPTTSFEAYDLFLRAKQWVNKFANSNDKSDLDQAVSMLKQSLRKDPQFAIAYAWLAGLQAVKMVESPSSASLRDSILLLATKALEIDSTVVEAYMVLSEFHHYENDDVNALQYTYKALDRIDDLRFSMNGNEGDSTVAAKLIERIASIYARIGDADRAVNLYDQMLKIDSGAIEILHQKFYPLAAGRHVDKLIELANQLERQNADDPFVVMVMTHIWLEQNDFQRLEALYSEKENVLSQQMNLLDQYVLVYAAALRKNGKEKGALQIARKFEEDLMTGGPYLQAQLLIFNGRYDEGLQVLNSVDLGWYNLNLCIVNPVFEPVRNDARFKNFINRNNDRIRDKSDRIYQLENDGFLPHPEEVLEGILSRKKSEFKSFESGKKKPSRA